MRFDGELDAAMLRHPGGRRRSIGFHRVELAPARTIEVDLFIPPVYIPAVYALECHGCGVLFRVGSPHLLDHHLAHRRRTCAQRARGLFARAGHRVRRALRRD